MNSGTLNSGALNSLTREGRLTLNKASPRAGLDPLDGTIYFFSQLISYQHNKTLVAGLGRHNILIFKNWDAHYGNLNAHNGRYHAHYVLRLDIFIIFFKVRLPIITQYAIRELK